MSAEEQTLEQPQSPRHLIQFCAWNDPMLVGNLSLYLEEGLRRGDNLLVVATQERIEALRQQVDATLQSAMERGAVTFFDSQETLARFMVNGQPDEDLLNKSVGAMVRRASVRDGNPRLSLCADMAGILWEAGQFAAALRLENLLNELMTWLGFDLFCTHPIDVFGHEFRIEHIDDLMCAHTHVVPAIHNEDLDAAINRAMDDVLGRRGEAIRLLMNYNFRPSWAAAPRAEAKILWLRSNLQGQADEILSRAKEYYCPSLRSNSGAA